MIREVPVYTQTEEVTGLEPMILVKLPDTCKLIIPVSIVEGRHQSGTRGDVLVD